MSTFRERYLFERLVKAWAEYVDDEDGNLNGMLNAIRALGDAMGFEWRDGE